MAWLLAIQTYQVLPAFTIDPLHMHELPRQHRSQLGKEPDYRFTLANERIFLAWIRTALALLAAGLILEQFAAMVGQGRLALWSSSALIMSALLCSITAYVRWRGNQRAMRLGRPLKLGIALKAVTATMVAVTIGLLWLLAR